MGSLISIKKTFVCYELLSTKGVVKCYQEKDKILKKSVVCLALIEEDTAFINIAFLPELNLMLGFVVTVYLHMLKKFAKQYTVSCCVTVQVKNGCCFNGNACRRILRRTDNLKQIIDTQIFDENEKQEAYYYHEDLVSFDKVIKTCFGLQLFKYNLQLQVQLTVQLQLTKSRFNPQSLKLEN